MTAFVAERSPHGLVVVSGPDATSFLQSLVSQDLDTIADGASASSLLLTPQGKLDVLFRITHVGDEWWLDTEADYGPRLAASLDRFKIRVKADIDDRTRTTGLLSVAGVSLASPALVSIATTWGDQPGNDLIGSVEAIDEVDVPDDAPRWSPEQFEAFRIEQGVPRMGFDIDDKTIPQEAFLERDAVSFTKGCFLGQELVARIDSRGHVNRYLRRVRVDGALPPRGASVIAGDKDVGAITSVAPVPDEGGAVALAMVRREVEPPADVTIRWSDTADPAQEAQAHVLASITHT